MPALLSGWLDESRPDAQDNSFDNYVVLAREQFSLVAEQGGGGKILLSN
jgi:hypothetical protein